MNLVTSLYASSLTPNAPQVPFTKKYTTDQRIKKRMQLLEKCGANQHSMVCVAISKGANSNRID